MVLGETVLWCSLGNKSEGFPDCGVFQGGFRLYSVIRKNLASDLRCPDQGRGALTAFEPLVLTPDITLKWVGVYFLVINTTWVRFHPQWGGRPNVSPEMNELDSKLLCSDPKNILKQKS